MTSVGGGGRGRVPVLRFLASLFRLLFRFGAERRRKPRRRFLLLREILATLFHIRDKKRLLVLFLFRRGRLPLGDLGFYLVVRLIVLVIVPSLVADDVVDGEAGGGGLGLGRHRRC